MIRVQDVELDPDSRRAWRGGREVVLSRKEFDLVEALMAHAGDIVTREELMRTVWHRKLGDDTRRPTLITTIRGKGLRFEVNGHNN